MTLKVTFVCNKEGSMKLYNSVVYSGLSDYGLTGNGYCTVDSPAFPQILEQIYTKFLKCRDIRFEESETLNQKLYTFEEIEYNYIPYQKLGLLVQQFLKEIPNA